MKKYLTHLIIIGLLGIIALVAFPVRNYYLFLKEPLAPLNNAIPKETVALVKAGSLTRFIEIMRGSDLFGLLEMNKTGPGVADMADQLTDISNKNGFIAEISGQNEIIICMVPERGLNPELLFLTGIGKTAPSKVRKQIEGILGPGLKITKFSHSPTDLFSVKTKDQIIWFYIFKGIMAVAFNRHVLEQSCNALIDNDQTKDRPFLRLSETSGKRVDGVLMTNNQKLIETVLQVSGNNPLNFNGSPFNGWTSLDLHIEKTRILMDGFTVGRQDSTLFDGQEPGRISNLELLPSGTAFAILLSISNQQAYTAGFVGKDTLQITGYDSANQTTSTEIFRREEHLRSWIGSNISFVAMPRYFTGDMSARLILIELKNADSAANMLKPYLQPYQGNINIFTAPTLPQMLWGRLFLADGRQYCLINGQVLVISPSLQLLHEYQKETDENRLFGTTPTFREASPLMLEKSNITIFAIPSVSGKYFKKQIRGYNSKISQKWTGLATSTDFLCLQINAGNPLHYTHAFALMKSGNGSQAASGKLKKLSPDTLKTEKPKVEQANDKAAWVKEKISISPVVDKLFLFPDLKSGENMILSFQKNVIRANSENGDKLWSFVCKENPAGEVFRIGLNQQKGAYFLFVAGTLLHIVDQNGREYKNSPVKLPSKPVSTPALFDYDRTKDYRLIYQGEDGLIYNVTIDGKELPEWQKPNLNNLLSGPPQFIRTGGKDYLIFADTKGRVIITDRRGRQRIKVEDSFRKSNSAGIFENRTNNKGIFLTVSANGNLAYIDINGKISESRFGDFGLNPGFDYRDFGGDSENEFIFCGNGNITVYTRMKNIVATASMPKAQFSKPWLYSSTKGSWLAVRDINSRKVMAFNTRNQIINNKTIFSDADPVIFVDEGGKKPVLVTMLRGQLIFTPLGK